jgi:hypothetical protein
MTNSLAPTPAANGIAHCDIALKEWAATCLALASGRQLLILRKGGIHDEAGSFQLENPHFWLQPTYIHQEQNLVKPEDRPLLAESEAKQREGENDKFIALQLWAKVEKVWSLAPENDAPLQCASHMWSDDYLAIRRSFRPTAPLLCVALRVWQMPEPYVVPMQTKFLGCRSWLDLMEPLSLQGAVPVLSDEQFDVHLAALGVAFGS